jgi:hypothetical protein
MPNKLRCNHINILRCFLRLSSRTFFIDITKDKSGKSQGMCSTRNAFSIIFDNMYRLIMFIIIVQFNTTYNNNGIITT